MGTVLSSVLELVSSAEQNLSKAPVTTFGGGLSDMADITLDRVL